MIKTEGRRKLINVQLLIFHQLLEILIPILFISGYFIDQERKRAGKYLHELVTLDILELKKIRKENVFVNKDLWGILKQ